MARKILVADRDPEYAQALAQRIQKHNPACTVATVSDEPAFQAALTHAAGELSLVVSAAHFPVDRLPAGIGQLILLETRIGPEDLKKPAQPVRLGHVQPILDRLDLAENLSHKSAKQTPPPAHAAISSVFIEPSFHALLELGYASTLDNVDVLNSQDGQENVPIPELKQVVPSGACGKPAPAATDFEQPRRVLLMLTQTIAGRQPTYADKRCRELGQSGESISYLPLMPNFYCRHANGCGSENGFSLTNLLLRISGGGLASGELGAYMAIDGLGRMQVRPCDRADDLLDCRPHDLFQLVARMRERTLAESGSLLVIEAAGIPYRSLQAIMPLCDAVEVIMPEDNGFAGQALRRELGEVLTELPASARLIQVPSGSCHASA